MPLWLLLANAWAGDFSGEAFGSPFVPTTVLAAPDPAHPGVLGVLATTEKYSCADLEKKKKPKTTILVVNADVATGAVSGGVFAGNQQFAVLVGTGKLGEVPAVGRTGTLDIELTAAGQPGKAAGTLTWTLCAAVPPPPPLTVELERGKVVLEDGLTAQFAAPKGWVAAENEYTKTDEWTGPDGFTQLSLSQTCAGYCESAKFREQATAWLDEVSSGYANQPDWKVEVIEKGEVSPGTWLVRWRTIGALGSTEYLDVMRWQPDWERLLHCNVTTQPHRAALIDGLREACTTVELVAP